MILIELKSRSFAAGLKINPMKTKFMIYVSVRQDLIVLDRVEIEEYVNIEWNVNMYRDSDAGISRSIKSRWKAYFTMKYVLNVKLNQTQCDKLFDRLEQAARNIGLFLNTDKIEFMCFKQGIISTLCGKPLKLEDQFTYLRIHSSSTESDINIKRNFFQAVARVGTTVPPEH